MERPLSQLIYTNFREASSPSRVITLHPYNAFYDQMREVGLAASPNGTVLGLQASKGVYLGRLVTGYTWFVGPLDRPSPVHFGDAMLEIEQFLWDEIDRQQSATTVLPFLIGEEQGGIMSLAMAAAVPDLLSGVVAIDATFPLVPGWEPPLSPLADLPVLLVATRPEEAAPPGVLAGATLVDTLEQWGAAVTVIEASSAQLLNATANPIAAWLDRQPVRMRRS